LDVARRRGEALAKKRDQFRKEAAEHRRETEELEDELRRVEEENSQSYNQRLQEREQLVREIQDLQAEFGPMATPREDAAMALEAQGVEFKEGVASAMSTQLIEDMEEVEALKAQVEEMQELIAPTCVSDTQAIRAQFEEVQQAEGTEQAVFAVYEAQQAEGSERGADVQDCGSQYCLFFFDVNEVSEAKKAILKGLVRGAIVRLHVQQLKVPEFGEWQPVLKLLEPLRPDGKCLL